MSISSIVIVYLVPSNLYSIPETKALIVILREIDIHLQYLEKIPSFFSASIDADKRAWNNNEKENTNFFIKEKWD